jgi:hypothetical protein
MPTSVFFMSLGNGLPGRVLWQTNNSSLSALLRWWGFRFEFLNVRVNFRSGKVSYFAYSLWTSAPGVRKSFPSPKDGEVGAVIIGVSSQSIINRSVPSSAVVEHPPYLLTPSRAASQSIGITLTPNAPEEIVRDAFDLKLNCLWRFEGCHRWNELLPAVQPLLQYN